MRIIIQWCKYYNSMSRKSKNEWNTINFFNIVCINFVTKAHINENDINYLYDGKGGAEFDKNLTFNQMANSMDKIRKKMNILVISQDDNINDINNIIRAKNIICPECNEDIKMNINNYKIYLFGCKNNHINNISFKEFGDKQKINLLNIKCEICKEKNKYNTYNNEFYKCNECKIYICPLCKIKHDKNHDIYNIDKIHYICNKHDEIYIDYCKDCNKNLCLLCSKEHSKHDRISIRDMILDKNELIIKLN